MINNLDLFKYSLKKKEPYFEEFYINKSSLIISDNPSVPNLLTQATNLLNKSIFNYQLAYQNSDKELMKRSILDIMEALKTKGINYTEFVSYWSVMDFSFGLYQSYLNQDEKYDFLTKIVENYLKERFLVYQKYGLSLNSLQALSDSKSHKKNGQSGIVKLESIFKEFGIPPFSGKNIEDFENSECLYISSDMKDKVLFLKILSEKNIKFIWSKDKEGKMPDFLFKIGGTIFILEHKHVKESGGGQNKQINEIIDFISHSDTKVSYVSFLDGLYFNLLADNRLKENKIENQRIKIEESLKNNPQNYFVNTFGFKKLLEFLVA